MSSRGAGADVSAVDEAFTSLTRALDVLTAGPWWQLAEDDLTDAVARLHQLEWRVAAAQVGAMTEAVSRGLPVAAGAASTGAWLRSLVPVTPSQASARCALAELLPSPDLAVSREAFASGAISPGHAGVLARTMTGLAQLPVPLDQKTYAEVQDLMVQTAARVDPSQLGKAGLRLRHVLDPDAAARLARDEELQARQRDAYLVQEARGCGCCVRSCHRLPGPGCGPRWTRWRRRARPPTAHLIRARAASGWQTR